jgi:hypothetical protein
VWCDLCCGAANGAEGSRKLRQSCAVLSQHVLYTPAVTGLEGCHQHTVWFLLLSCWLCCADGVAIAYRSYTLLDLLPCRGARSVVRGSCSI